MNQYKKVFLFLVMSFCAYNVGYARDLYAEQKIIDNQLSSLDIENEYNKLNELI